MNIIITGSSRGIGFQTAVHLSKDESNTIIAFSRSEEGLATLKANAAHNNIHTYKIDPVKDDASTITKVLDKYDSIDVLINNAGQLINKKFEQLSIEDWQQTIEANLFSAVKMIQVTLPFLKKNSIAHIVNIGSMGGFQGSSKFLGLSAYSASKAAIGNLTECLAEELKEHNIRVNCLALGAIDTEMLKEAFPDYSAPVSSEEIAGFISHFSTKSHHFINGKIIPISVSTP